MKVGVTAARRLILGCALVGLAAAGSIGAWTVLDIRAARSKLAGAGYAATAEAFLAAACGNDFSVAPLFLEAKVDATAADSNGYTVLHCAAAFANEDVIRSVIAAGGNPHSQAFDLTTPLHLAAKHNKLNNAKVLLLAGADPNANSAEGTPLARASSDGKYLPMVQLLLEKGAEINRPDRWGNTPLHVASSRAGQAVVVDALLQAGANPTAVGRDAMTPLHLACQSRDDVIVGLLLAKGANVNALSKVGSPLLDATGNPGLMRQLLAKGADPNLAATYGRQKELGMSEETPLVRAVLQGNLSVVSLLLEAGAHPGSVVSLHGTALHAAARTGNVEIAKLLIARGANVNANDCCGNRTTPLHQAVAATNPSSLAMITLLVDWGADVNALNAAGRTPLIEARHQTPEVVSLLIARGANINHRDLNGWSVLGWFKNRKSSSVENLTKLGAKD